MSLTRVRRRQVVEEIATEVGRLRRRTDLEVNAYRVDVIASLVEVLWIDVTPTAAEFVREGLTVDEALEEAEREKRRHHRILADDTVERRRVERLRQSEETRVVS